MRLTVIIPIFNEQVTLEKVLKQVFTLKNVYEVIAVNDGSTDNTGVILNKFQNSFSRFKVASHNKNMGKGQAIKTGLRQATGDFVIIQDADLEYTPKEFVKLTKSVTHKNTATFGSRIKGGNPHAYFSTYLGNVLLTAFTNLLFGSKLTDIYTCYKLIPLKIMKKLNIQSRGFEVEAEITAKLLKEGVNIVEVPITFAPRSYENGKKIRAIDALRGLVTLLTVRFT